jgi:hypothetical protein
VQTDRKMEECVARSVAARVVPRELDSIWLVQAVISTYSVNE